MSNQASNNLGCKECDVVQLQALMKLWMLQHKLVTCGCMYMVDEWMWSDRLAKPKILAEWVLLPGVLSVCHPSHCTAICTSRLSLHLRINFYVGDTVNQSIISSVFFYSSHPHAVFLLIHSCSGQLLTIQPEASTIASKIDFILQGHDEVDPLIAVMKITFRGKGGRFWSHI